MGYSNIIDNEGKGVWYFGSLAYFHFFEAFNNAFEVQMPLVLKPQLNSSYFLKWEFLSLERVFAFTLSFISIDMWSLKKKKKERNIILEKLYKLSITHKKKIMMLFYSPFLFTFEASYHWILQLCSVNFSQKINIFLKVSFLFA